MDKELLFKAQVNEAEVDLNAGTVRVRGLTRGEMHAMQAHKADPTLVEQRTVKAGLVDPQLSLEEVKRWYETGLAGDVQKVVDAILGLSGMTPGSDKEAYRQFRDES